jgi:pimeloyl-ACP methyl ester carboxylesterase
MIEQLPLERAYESSHGEVRYDSIGDGNPVVMVHGTPWSSYVWRHVAPALGETHTVYVYDLPGYGQSEKFEGQDVSLGIQNDVLAELIEYWALDTPAIVGHDFGGATVLRAHLLNEVPFARIALLDAVSLRPWGSSFYQHVREHQDAFAGMPEYIHRAVVRAYIRGAFYRDVSDEKLEPYIEPWLGTGGQPAFYRQIAQNGPKYTDEVEDRYGEIGVPVLVLWGEQDEWLPVEIGQRLHARIPESTFETIPEAGHLVQEDAAEIVTSRLSAFLNEER